MKPIYIATLGDAWLSKDSLDVIGYYSTEKKALNAIKTEIKAQGFKLNDYSLGQTQGEYGVRHKDKNGDYFFENIGCYNIEIVNMNKRY